MRARMLLIASLVVNVLLVVAFLTSFRGGQSTPRIVRAPNPGLIVSNNTFRIVKTNILVRPRNFNWSEVESDDYVAYIENLRLIGCPESTIRDIIVADVNQMFARKRRDELAASDFEWWRTDLDAEQQKLTSAKIETLEKERQTLLTRLLGSDWDKPPVEMAESYVPLTGEVLSSLAPETKEAVQKVSTAASQRYREYIKGLDQTGDSVDETHLARIRDETRAELAKVLTPVQLEEYLLRYSFNANQLRQQLRGLNLGAEEFRNLFRVTDSLDRELQLVPNTDEPAVIRRRQALQQRREAALRDVLGAENFRNYRLAQDPRYQEALAVAEQAGAGRPAGMAVYEIMQAAMQEQERIQGDRTLTAQQKEEMLKNIEREQQVARAQVLGEQPSLPPLPPNPINHRVAAGETLAHVALRYGVRMSAIREANPDLDFSQIRAGSQISIPPPNRLPPIPEVGR